MKIFGNDIYLKKKDVVALGLRTEKSLRVDITRNRKGQSPYWQAKTEGNASFILFNSIPAKYHSIIKAELFNGLEPDEYLRCVEQEKAIEDQRKLQSHWVTQVVVDADELEQLRNDDRFKGSTKGLEEATQTALAAAYCRFYNTIKPSKVKALTGFDGKPALLEAIEQQAYNTERPIKPLQCCAKRIQRKAMAYKKQGIEALITKKRGNSNSAKIKNESQRALIRQLYAERKLDKEDVTDLYNEAAAQMGWAQVSAHTVKSLLAKHRKQVELKRNGMAVWRNEFDPIINRTPPSKPNYMWVGDGTPFEFYYQTEKRVNGKLERKYWNRKVVYAVVDAFNGYIVGYAIGKTENRDLAIAAWANACETQGVLPAQAQVDNFGIKGLKPFYSAMARYCTPTRVGNARGKVIESRFGLLNRKEMRRWDNFSGCNITAKSKDAAANREKLMGFKSQFPTEHQIDDQIAHVIEYYNNRTRKQLGNKSIRAQWLEADHQEDRALDTATKVALFGKWSEYGEREGYQFTNKGIQLQVDGVKKNYFPWHSNEVFDELIGHNKLRLRYDEQDRSVVLVVTPDHRFYALPESEKVPMALLDHSTESRQKLQQYWDFKEENTQQAQLANARDMELLESIGALKMLETKPERYLADSGIKQLDKTEIKIEHAETVSRYG